MRACRLEERSATVIHSRRSRTRCALSAPTRSSSRPTPKGVRTGWSEASSSAPANDSPCRSRTSSSTSRATDPDVSRAWPWTWLLRVDEQLGAAEESQCLAALVADRRVPDLRRAAGGHAARLRLRPPLENGREEVGLQLDGREAGRPFGQ